MAIIRDNYTKYQVVASATQNGLTFYAVKSENSEEIEMLSLKELKLLAVVSLPLFDADMSPLRFNGNTIIGNIPDMSDSLDEEETEVYEDNEDNDADDFFSAYGSDEEDEYSDSSLDEDYSDEDDSEDDILAYDEEEEVIDEVMDDEIDDFYSAYGDDDEDEEGSTVGKLYSYLTAEQIKVLKRYYLWFSQRIFTDAQKDPTLGLHSATRLAQKKADLNALRNTGGMWQYAGFIDMGRQGGGYCTLGHALRYKHLAWDVEYSDIESAFFGEDWNVDFEEVIESNNCITFGIKCIGDFFEVSSECIRALQKAQRDSLKDMATLYEFYENGKANEVNDSFILLDKVMREIKIHDAKIKLLGEGYTPIVPYGLTSFYSQFREVNLVPPKSLIQEIRDSIVGWDSHKFSGELHYPKRAPFVDVVDLLLPKGYMPTLEKYSEIRLRTLRLDSYTDAFMHYLYLFFTYKICGYYAYNADTHKDEGGASKTAKYYFSSHHNKMLPVSLDISLMSKAESFFSIEDLRKCAFIAHFMDFELSRMDVNVSHSFKSQWSNSTSCSLSAVSLWSRDLPNSVIESIKEYDRINGTSMMSTLDFCRAFRYYDSYSYTRTMRNNKGLLLGNDDGSLYDRFYETCVAASNAFKGHIESVKTFVSEREEAAYKVYEAEIAEIEAKKQEEERLRKEKEEAEHLAKLEAMKKVEGIKTVDDVVAYLKNADLSALGSEYNLPKQILETVLKSGKSPSRNQFYHIQRLYEKVSGVEFKGSDTTSDRVNLSDRPSLKVALEYVAQNKSLVDERTWNIVCSILKYGTISERQMKYAIEAEKVYKTVEAD